MSELIEHKKRKLLGHIMRLSDEQQDDPLFQVTFKEDGRINVYKKRRVGRPRGWWAEDAMDISMKWLQGIFSFMKPLMLFFS